MRKYRVIIYFAIYLAFVYGSLAIFFKSPFASRLVQQWVSQKAAEKGVVLTARAMRFELLDFTLVIEGVNVLSHRYGIDVRTEKLSFVLRPIYLLSGILGFDAITMDGGRIRVVNSHANGARSVTDGRKEEFQPLKELDFIDRVLRLRFYEISLSNIDWQVDTESARGACHLNKLRAERKMGSHVDVSFSVDGCSILRAKATDWERKFPITRAQGALILEEKQLVAKELVVSSPGAIVTATGEWAYKGEIRAQAVVDLLSLNAAHPFAKYVQGEHLQLRLSAEGPLVQPKVQFEVHGKSLRVQEEWDVSQVDGMGTYSAGRVKVDTLDVSALGGSFHISPLTWERGQIGGTVAIRELSLRPFQTRLDPKGKALLFGLLKGSVEIGGRVQGKAVELTFNTDLHADKFEVKSYPNLPVVFVEKLYVQAKCQWRSQDGPFTCADSLVKANDVPIKARVNYLKDFVVEFDVPDLNVPAITPYVAHFKIKGHGPAKGRVVSRANRKNPLFVDAEVSLKGAMLDDIDLGDVHMGVTYDEEPDVLGFRHFQMKVNPATATGDVEIHFAPAETEIHGKAVFQQASSDDLDGWGMQYLPDVVLFDGGTWNGNLTFDGPPTLGKFTAHAELHGKHADWLEQNFDALEVRLTADQEGVRLPRFELTKSQWSARGELFVSTRKDISGALHARSVQLSDVSLPIDRSANLKGSGDIDLKLSGSIAHAKIDAQADVHDTFINGIAAGDGRMTYHIDASNSDREATVHWNQGGRASFLWTDTDFRLDTQLDHMNVYPFMQLAFPLKSNGKNKLVLTAKGKVIGKRKPFRFTEGQMQVEDIQFLSAASELHVQPTVIAFKEGRAAVNAELRGPSVQTSVRGAVDTSGDGTLAVKGTMALGWVADWIDFIDWSQGEMSVNTNVILSRGELKGIRGTGNISNGVVDFAFLNERMQDLSGSFRLLDEGVLFEGLEGKLGDGAITIGGRVGYPWMSPSKMDLTLDFREIRIKPYTDLSLILSGKLNLEGTQTPYKVKGHVNVLRADIAGDHFSEELSNREIESRFVPREFQKGRGEVFALDVGISIPSKFRVESRVFTGDLKGDFRLQGTDSNPVVLGNLSITSGDLAIRDNRFVIDSGNLRFENTNRVDPLLNVSTHMDIVSEERKYRVYLNILGAWSYPQLEYSSDPPLSPEDITSLVVFGVTTQQFEEKEGQSVSQELVPQLFARSGVSRTLEKKTGLKVQLDSYYNSTKEGTTLPRISVSRRVGKDVNVKFISNIDQETYREFNVEYQLNNNVSLKGLWEGRSAAASTTTSTPTAQTDDVKNSFGGDIQFKFEFE